MTSLTTAGGPTRRHRPRRPDRAHPRRRLPDPPERPRPRARCRARATSARRSASPTSSPWPTPTSCATAPTTRTGPAATGSCSRSATTPSRSTRRWPRPGSSRSRSWRPTAPTSPGCRCRAWRPTPPAWRSPAARWATAWPSPPAWRSGCATRATRPAVFNLLSDGELDEGSTWEAALQIAHHGLDNVTAIVDVNALQADGPTAGVLRTEPVTDKWQAFGWHALRVDGNDIAALVDAFDELRAHRARPGC